MTLTHYEDESLGNLEKKVNRVKKKTSSVAECEQACVEYREDQFCYIPFL